MWPRTKRRKTSCTVFYFSLHYLPISRLHNWTESERIPVIEQKSLCHCIILPCSFSLNVTIKLKTNRGREKQRHSVKIAIKKNSKNRDTDQCYSSHMEFIAFSCIEASCCKVLDFFRSKTKNNLVTFISDINTDG